MGQSRSVLTFYVCFQDVNQAPTVPDLDALDFQACHDAMRRSGLSFTPTEAHAIAVGIFSGRVVDPAAQWQAAVYADFDPNDALASECRSQLDAVYEVAQAQAEDSEFGLQLFMPPAGDYPMVRALRDWAQGFLYGYGLGGEAASQCLSADGREALQDFYEIAQLDVGETEDNEDGDALMQVEEYMRVAAMLIYEDNHAAPSAQEEGLDERH